jgi:aquaporin Z
MSPTIRKGIAEFIGTFWLVFMGCGSVAFFLMSSGGDKDILFIRQLAVAIAFGLTVVTMAYAIGHISGAHLNPAVSVGAVVAGRMPAKDLPIYVGAQVLGGIVAAFLVAWIGSMFNTGMSKEDLGDMSEHVKSVGPSIKMVAAGVSNMYSDGGKGHPGFGIVPALLGEFIMTFMFMLVILGSTAKKATPAMAGLVIGLCLTLIHIVLIPVTGTSVNPARSLGPALFGGSEALKHVWLFLLVPTAGAALAGLVHKTVLTEPGETP